MPEEFLAACTEKQSYCKALMECSLCQGADYPNVYAVLSIQLETLMHTEQKNFSLGRPVTGDRSTLQSM